MVLKNLLWVEDEDRSGALTGITSKQDANKTLIQSGDVIRWDKAYPYVVMVYAGAETTAAGGGFQYAKLTSPSITQRPFYIHQGFGERDSVLTNTWNTSGSPRDVVMDFRHAPLPLFAHGEDITASIAETDEAGVAHFGFINIIAGNSTVGIGAQAPVTNIVRATTAAVSAAVTWENLSLTLADTLAAGKYACYGADVVSATACAAGIYFTNRTEQGAIPRPIIPRRNASEAIHPYNKNWGKGIQFSYPANLPLLSIISETTDTPEVVQLFLRYLGPE